MRGQPWPLAHELFVVMLSRIEDSGGELTLSNCMKDSHLNTVIDEASASAKHHYGAAFFRQVAQGVRGRNGDDDEPGRTGTPWNGKSTASASDPCWHFNAGKPHTRDVLLPDGTCKRAHKCDHFVDNKGPGGRCLGTAGTPGHSRANCDNPHKCDAKVTGTK